MSSLAFLPSRAVDGAKKQFTAVSFFCGCGGLDLGFLGGFTYKDVKYKSHPFNILEAYDFEAKAVETYKQNIGHHVHSKDLTNLNPAEFAAADLLIGGFPCQDFSSCGPQAGLKSKRGQLYKSLMAYMTYHQPKLVIGENVPGLARINQGEDLAKIKNDFESCGYRFEVWTLYAPDFGIPQTRTRLFLIGVRDDLPGFPEEPTPQFASGHRSIKWAIGDLEKAPAEILANHEQFFLASRAKKGNGQGDEKSKPDEPGYTVRANPKSRVPFHYTLDRRLTVRECARLQTFPDNFKFPHSATTNIMQIGNAVPPVLAHAVAGRVAKHMRAHDL